MSQIFYLSRLSVLTCDSYYVTTAVLRRQALVLAKISTASPSFLQRLHLCNRKAMPSLVSDEQLQQGFKLPLNLQLLIRVTFRLLSVTVEIDERFYVKEAFLRSPRGFQDSLFSLFVRTFSPESK